MEVSQAHSRQDQKAIHAWTLGDWWERKLWGPPLGTGRIEAGFRRPEPCVGVVGVTDQD